MELDEVLQERVVVVEPVVVHFCCLLREQGGHQYKYTCKKCKHVASSSSTNYISRIS